VCLLCVGVCLLPVLREDRPALYVEANELQPRSHRARFREMFPQGLDGKTVGSGHFCQLEVPRASQRDDLPLPRHHTASVDTEEPRRRSDSGAAIVSKNGLDSAAWDLDFQ
jgi:hypothetical protein